ncbi:hypothetical protein ZIOFF_006359 [Zingiber officinale]|uniref:Protein kinase domain-containing protein n=1 Tax=Zingiber officinale TaxID=94328 RepID=A0A8J5M516_ZINOF|nr:hypothetical protein ZIOFF_006359 [Zingiber officinale]
MGLGLLHFDGRVIDDDGRPLLESDDGEELMHVEPGVAVLVSFVSAVSGLRIKLPGLHEGDEDEESESSDSESNDDLELSKVTEMRLLPSDAGKCSFLFLQMTTPISIEDVRREVKILKALSNHNNLVKFYDACGELLERILSRGGRYSEEDAKAIVIQILSVIAFCHLQGVVHRDLKPEEKLRNFIFTTRDENAQMKLIDFGLSDFVKPGPIAKCNRVNEGE